VISKEKCPVNGQWVHVLRTADELQSKPQLDPGTEVRMDCQACPDPISPDPHLPGCDYEL
jgi:hypothetical protein